ncbi:MAG: L-aspartate oxidase [Campylobacterota bacterium]|nr:L-aspartate oxidase [Campylobacterota bacterium]
MKYDVVIIGAGVAGLYAAINLPASKKVLVINKVYPWECNTYYAQGGVSTAYDEEDVEQHVADTLSAGAGLCDEEAVRVMSGESRSVIKDLLDRGFDFDRGSDGELLYTKEAAHSRSRILHAGGDATGRYLHHFLLAENPHPMLYNATVVDLLIEENQCCGVTVSHNGELKQIMAKHVVIASGGVGSLYEFHTNAYKISGDLQGICIEKGIPLENMEMMQFHPTVYVSNDSVQKQLLTEALRGEGAIVEDENGYRFLFDYDERGELAPRDIVSHALFDYAQRSGQQVYLSFSNFDYFYFKKRFPNIFSKLQALGFNVPMQRVPISPAFHYAIGGIKTDLDGQIPTMPTLYAVGEVASTGVHGANRLASNSLLEGLVFSRRAVQKILDSGDAHCPHSFPFIEEPLILDEDKAKKDRLRRIMWEKVSIVRTRQGLEEVQTVIRSMLHEKIGRLLKLRLLTALSIVEAALARKESVGVHYISSEES